jgi:hypothetical protein
MTSFRPSKKGGGIEFDVQANFDSHGHDTFVHFGNRLSLDLHLKLGVTRERERQDMVYGAAFYAIEQFVEQPGEENEHKQKLHRTKPVKRA